MNHHHPRHSGLELGASQEGARTSVADLAGLRDDLRQLVHEEQLEVADYNQELGYDYWQADHILRVGMLQRHQPCGTIIADCPFFCGTGDHVCLKSAAQATRAILPRWHHCRAALRRSCCQRGPRCLAPLRAWGTLRT